MKKIVLANFLVMNIVLSISCAGGYYSKDGDSLQKYLVPERLKELTAEPDPNIWIIDLRYEFLYKSGHIPTAKSYPLGSLMNKLDEIPKDKYLVFYCVASPGAQTAIEKLEEKGYTKMLNWGGYYRWPYKTEQGM